MTAEEMRDAAGGLVHRSDGDLTLATAFPERWVTVALGALTITLLSVFDQALDEVAKTRLPAKTCSLGNKVREFARAGWLVDSASTLSAVELRNRLAHQLDSSLTWDDWTKTVDTVVRELTHLNLLPKTK